MLLNLIVWLHKSLLYVNGIHFSWLNWIIAIITLPVSQLSSRLEQPCQWFFPPLRLHLSYLLFSSGIKVDLIILVLSEENPSLRLAWVPVVLPDWKWITPFYFLLNLLKAKPLLRMCYITLSSSWGDGAPFLLVALSNATLNFRVNISQCWKPICLKAQLTK